MNTKIRNLDELAQRVYSLDKVSWKELYSSEEDLINDMMNINIKGKHYRWIKGQYYIENFQRYYTRNGKLEDKQIIQLKRIAREIAKYYVMMNRR